MRSKKVVYNIITNLILQIIIILYGFIVPKIIISSYGSNVNGLISSITQFLAYITLLESGFGPVVKAALYKPIAENDNKTIARILKTTEKFFRTLAIIFLVYILILCFIYPLLTQSDFSWLYTISLIIIIGISTFAEYFFGMTYKLYLQASQKAYIISIIQIISYILSIILIVVLSLLESSIHMIKLISGIVFVLRPLIQNLYVRKKCNISLKDVEGNFVLKQKWEGMAQHIAFVIHGNTDITVLTFLTNLVEVSVYSVYYLVVKGIKSIIQAFNSGIDATFGDMITRKEHENLNKKFGMYEIIYNTISTITFSCAIVLIVPFVMVYTKGITDANYIRYTFGTLIVISEYIWAIRLPYSSITLAAGHFKETKVGSWVECVSNIIISVILVKKYGLVGVTIGTIFAMTIRTIEFVYHANKYILNRSSLESLKKILLVIGETIIIVVICKYLPYTENISYFNWIINAIMVFIVAIVITIGLNFLFLKKEFKSLIKLFINMIKKNKTA